MQMTKNAQGVCFNVDDKRLKKIVATKYCQSLLRPPAPPPTDPPLPPPVSVYAIPLTDTQTNKRARKARLTSSVAVIDHRRPSLPRLS